MSTVCKEEYVACAAEIHQGSRIRQKISRDLSTHWLFLVETIVESVPQCVLQLLAVSQMGTAMTPIQMASLLLSFCSIASKAHFISYSPTLSMYVFKVGLVIHDVASMILLCSSMLASSNAPPAGEGLPLPFFPDVPVSLPAFIVGSTGASAGALAFQSSTLAVRGSSEVRKERSTFMAVGAAAVLVTQSTRIAIGELSAWVMVGGSCSGRPNAVACDSSPTVAVERASSMVLAGVTMVATSGAGAALRLSSGVTVASDSLLSDRCG
jgi:hypothetical protein